VETAANTLISRLLIISTRDTPDVAASPALETIIVSTMPTVTARICSTMSGAIRRFKSLFVNKYCFCRPGSETPPMRSGVDSFLAILPVILSSSVFLM